MNELELNAIAFPAMADVGSADADVSSESSEIAWRNGVGVANGNLVLRPLGIPTVTVPMNTTYDTGIPVGLTFAGRAYDDAELLTWAHTFESKTKLRTAPFRTTLNAASV